MKSAQAELALAPLGAGDLIDRAVRLYRRHFLTLIRIAAPPVVVFALGSTISTIGIHAISTTPSTARMVGYFFMIVGGAVIMVAAALFSLIVMGGAARNLVAHLLWDEPVSFRATYAAVKSRFWSLFGASILIGLWLTFCSWLAILGFYLVMLVVFVGVVAVASVIPEFVTAIVVVVGIITGAVGALILFFLLAGRMAYVPQAILVEGRTVGSAIGRSFSLASGNVRRLMAMGLFTFFATYSALALLIIPLGWYGWANGVNISLFSSEWPAWYAIAYEVIVHCSYILLAPIWLLGLSLLYVDERVRHEGYDIELMAARQLPPMPELPGVISPFAPALVTRRMAQFVPPPAPMPPQNVLGLQ
ncbi:MAG TPA: hypothetical protein VFX97_10570 [Pyrinomonadaceae bacterium]|nr:hypothetical protein [Pyrinomonadaceae bacterium]